MIGYGAAMRRFRRLTVQMAAESSDFCEPGSMQCPKESDKILLVARKYVNNSVLTKLLGLREIYPCHW